MDLAAAGQRQQLRSFCCTEGVRARIATVSEPYPTAATHAVLSCQNIITLSSPRTQAGAGAGGGIRGRRLARRIAREGQAGRRDQAGQGAGKPSFSCCSTLLLFALSCSSQHRSLPAGGSRRPLLAAVGAPADLELTAACPQIHKCKDAIRDCVRYCDEAGEPSVPCPALRCAALAWHASPILAACTAPVASSAKRRAQAAVPGRVHAPGLPSCMHAHTTSHHTTSRHVTPHHTTPHRTMCRVACRGRPPDPRRAFRL